MVNVFTGAFDESFEFITSFGSFSIVDYLYTNVVDVPVKLTLEELHNGRTKTLRVNDKYLPKGSHDKINIERILPLNIRPGTKDQHIYFHIATNHFPKHVFCYVCTLPHRHFTREGNDLVYTCPISKRDLIDKRTPPIPLISGGSTHFPLPNNLLHVRSNFNMTVPGYGMHYYDGKLKKRGNLIIKFQYTG